MSAQKFGAAVWHDDDGAHLVVFDGTLPRWAAAEALNARKRGNVTGRFHGAVYCKNERAALDHIGTRNMDTKTRTAHGAICSARSPDHTQWMLHVLANGAQLDDAGLLDAAKREFAAHHGCECEQATVIYDEQAFAAAEAQARQLSEGKAGQA